MGPVVGALLLGPVIEYLRSTFKEAYILMYGVILVIVPLFVPGGIVGQAQRMGRALARRMGQLTRTPDSPK